jgi:hypothetical protein
MFFTWRDGNDAEWKSPAGPCLPLECVEMRMPLQEEKAYKREKERGREVKSSKKIKR